MTQVHDIFTLQGYDDEAAALRAALASVEQRLLGDDELNDARRQLIDAESRLAVARKEQRAAESHVEDLTARIEPEEKRLYGGTVKSPKELSAIQHELDLLKHRRGEFEDTLLGVMDRIEQIQQERDRVAKLVEQYEARWEKHQVELRTETRRLNDQITRAEARREGQKALIPPRSLLLYEDLRRRKGGMGVSRIQGSNCMGCRIALPDAVRRRAFSAPTLSQCPNCERILFFG
jgi:hypothetical protein